MSTFRANECRFPNLVKLAYVLVTMDRDLGAALLLSDVMLELRNRLPPSYFAELQAELREVKQREEAERQSRTHEAPETAQ